MYKETKAEEDLPGLGRHYCTECAKWFETETSLDGHKKGKPHRRRSVYAVAHLAVIVLTDMYRLKDLREGPYTHAEANAAVSYRIDNGPEKTKSQEIEMS